MSILAIPLANPNLSEISLLLKSNSVRLVFASRPSIKALASVVPILPHLKFIYSKTCLKRPLKRRPKLVFKTNYHLMQVKSIAECSLEHSGQKYCRMLPREHSAILSTCIKPTYIFKNFVLSIFEWPLKTGFTVGQVKHNL